MNWLLKIIEIYRRYGIKRVIELVKLKILYSNVVNDRPYQKLFENKCGIEIGGPSKFFKTTINIYDKIKSLDGVNFSESTMWEKELTDGWNYRYDGKETGYQYISDAVYLSNIESGKYDFVLSCNNLEHIANPMKALEEWIRVIKSNGIILLVLPNKVGNFDHNRKITRFEHLLDDYSNNVSEKDLTHLEEILKFHDLTLDPLAGDIENFKNRSLNNFQNRCLHHHVFDLPLLRSIFDYLNIVVCLEGKTTSDYIILGRLKE